MALDELVDQVAHLLPPSGNRRQQMVQPIPGLRLVRQGMPSRLENSLYEPILCLILQGAKQVSIADRTVSLDVGECLLVSHDLPVSSAVTRAPYLALVLSIDMPIIRNLYGKVGAYGPEPGPARAARRYQADAPLLDALHRYVALAQAPADAQVLGPLVCEEIHYRLLVSPFGGMLRSLVRHDSNASAVARAIGRIRHDIRAAIVVPDLARQVGMSASAFHRHFKMVTSTTPLQYQKELRLLEARQLLTIGGASVTAAAVEVGYESASQFSREYARKFGVPPSRDTAGSTG